MSKFKPLWQYVSQQQIDYLELSFADIADILGFSIDHSFLICKKELADYGYLVKKISLKDKKVIFEKLA